MRTLTDHLNFSAIVKAPFGAVGVRTEAGAVCELVYLPEQMGQKKISEIAPTDRVAERMVRQLTAYFLEPDSPFNVPLTTVGTPFQRKVWSVISSIPRGQVLTYGEIAKKIRSAPRAVGQACGANWFPLVIPCHRVTAVNGLGGFARHGGTTGFHVGVKRWLLAHEGITVT